MVDANKRRGKDLCLASRMNFSFLSSSGVPECHRSKYIVGLERRIYLIITFAYQLLVPLNDVEDFSARKGTQMLDAE